MDLTKSTKKDELSIFRAKASHFAKRMMDIIISVIVLIVLSPFLALIALAIKFDSPGPVLYRGPRTGCNWKPFKILKFRTMEECPQSYSGPKITACNDPRITKVGHWLRDTKLNELPQFWNVLKGEMSLVGPRPEDPEIARTLSRNIWDEILSIRPGITSPASIHYHNEERLLSVWNVEETYLRELGPDKMRLDQLYVRYRSFWLDLDVLFLTALILLPKIGSNELPEDILFLGFITRLIKRFFNWFTIDWVTSLVAFWSVLLIYRAFAPLDVGWLNSLALGGAYALLFSITGVTLGTNRVSWSRANPADFLDLLPSWILATVIIFIVNSLTGFLPSSLILVASCLALFGFIIVRYRQLIISGLLKKVFHEKNQTVRERVLIIGIGASAQHTSWLLEHLVNSGVFYIVGFVDNDLMKQGMRFYGSSVLGKWQDIPNLVEKYDVGIIILADYRVDAKDYKIIKKICSSTSAQLVVMPDILVSISHLVRPFKNNPVIKNVDINYSCVDCLARYSSYDRKHYWKNWAMKNELSAYQFALYNRHANQFRQGEILQ
jgi:lipopolysaccharide/colanic/teichoic acid biosynthesis glycosyltransferase